MANTGSGSTAGSSHAAPLTAALHSNVPQAARRAERSDGESAASNAKTSICADKREILKKAMSILSEVQQSGMP
jgi:hypothetical protein